MIELKNKVLYMMVINQIIRKYIINLEDYKIKMIKLNKINFYNNLIN